MSWQQWHKGLGRLIGRDGLLRPFRKELAPLFVRVQECWSRLGAFFSERLSHVNQSLHPGLTSEVGESIQQQLHVENDIVGDDQPLYGLEILYLILSKHDGQTLGIDSALFGGYSAYDYIVSIFSVHVVIVFEKQVSHAYVHFFSHIYIFNQSKFAQRCL
jgi:hypothetical protein